MTDKQPMQAAGEDGREGAADGVGDPATSGIEGGGQSSGGAYPNPHAGKDGKGSGERGWTGHGGQSEIDYHGPGQLGQDAIPDAPDPNATTGR